jgi:hypothetical protein
MMRRHAWLILLLTPSLARSAQSRGCISLDQAPQMLEKDICISAHVYNVVQLADGTRYLDVCSPNTPDDACRFTIVSLREDRDTVGELARYQDMDVQVRGIVQPMHGRAGIILSHARQFRGGPPKFRPNPKLAHGFGGQDDRPPVSDPNLRSQGQSRSFMNSRNQEVRSER